MGRVGVNATRLHFRVGAAAPSAQPSEARLQELSPIRPLCFPTYATPDLSAVCGAESFQEQPKYARLGALATLINYPLPFELVTENLQPHDNSLTSANPLSMYPFFDKAEAQDQNCTARLGVRAMPGS